jgi:hypothetical protein
VQASSIEDFLGFDKRDAAREGGLRPTLMSRFFMGKEVCRSGELDGIFAALLDRPAFVALARYAARALYWLRRTGKGHGRFVGRKEG